MKIRYFSPLVALLLVGCGSSAADSAKDPNLLAPSPMQPVEGTGASEGSYGWSGEVQAAPMPASMK